MKIGFIGLGKVGRKLAASLLRSSITNLAVMVMRLLLIAVRSALTQRFTRE